MERLQTLDICIEKGHQFFKTTKWELMGLQVRMFECLDISIQNSEFCFPFLWTELFEQEGYQSYFFGVNIINQNCNRFNCETAGC